MSNYIQKFERLITGLLLAMMSIVVSLSVADLAWLLVKDVISPPILLIDVNELLDFFGLFLLVMIGIELLETLKTYVAQKEIRAEIIILVALIALARKVITIDVKDVPSISLIGIAAIIIALSVAYYLIKRTHSESGELNRSEHSHQVQNLKQPSRKDSCISHIP